MPNRSTALEWETDADAPLRTDLVDAALALADEQGLEAVSVRRVAARVGCRPMTLYSHVPSKDALVALMFERVSADLLVSEPKSGDGRAWLTAIVRRALETYLAHPWMLHAFGYRPPPGPNQHLRAQRSTEAVRALGVSSKRTRLAVSLVHEWTMGRALHLVTLREDDELRAAFGGPARDDEGLEAILDAVGAL